MTNVKINCTAPITNPVTRRYNFNLSIMVAPAGTWGNHCAAVIDTGTVDLDKRPISCDDIDILDYYLNDDPYIYDADAEEEEILIVTIYDRDEDGSYGDRVAFNYLPMRDLPNAQPRDNYSYAC